MASVGIVDFHTHMLPGMDDGSRSLVESLRMLRVQTNQGVCCAILTPHFYANEEDPARFLARREKTLATLRAECVPGSPVLVAGAEVHYFEGIADVEEVSSLCIGSTNVMLLEMPQKKWSARMIAEVQDLQRSRGFQIVIAHMERYMDEQPRGTVENFVSNGILIQSNAHFFLGRFSRRRALDMLEAGLIHVVGSDCHNMTSRPPQMGECMALIEEKLGAATADRLNMQALRLLSPVKPEK